MPIVGKHRLSTDAERGVLHQSEQYAPTQSASR